MMSGEPAYPRLGEQFKMKNNSPWLYKMDWDLGMDDEQCWIIILRPAGAEPQYPAGSEVFMSSDPEF
jgi:hypothetical protein